MSTEHLHQFVDPHAGSPSARGPGPHGTQQGPVARTWTWLEILALMLGFTPLGILGLWYSAASIVSSQRGELDAARRSGRRALVASVSALVVSALLVLAGVVVGAVLLAGADVGAVPAPGI